MPFSSFISTEESPELCDLFQQRLWLKLKSPSPGEEGDQALSKHPLSHPDEYPQPIREGERNSLQCDVHLEGKQRKFVQTLVKDAGSKDE